MSSHRDSSFEVWVATHEKRVQSIHLHPHFFHNGLAVGGAVVEQNVKECFIGEVAQASNARQSDFFYVPSNIKIIRSMNAFEEMQRRTLLAFETTGRRTAE